MNVYTFFDIFQFGFHIVLSVVGIKLVNVKKLENGKCEIASAVTQVEEEKSETAGMVMIGPPLGGQESDLENENDDSLCVYGLPNEVSYELEVFNFHNEGLSDDDHSNHNSVETTAPPTSKKAKKGKPHKAVKLEKKHLNPKPTSKPDQALKHFC